MRFKKLSDIDNYIKLGKILFPICRSLTGNGNRQTLKILKKKINNLKILEIPSGKKFMIGRYRLNGILMMHMF